VSVLQAGAPANKTSKKPNDALHRTLLLMRESKQAIADYLGEVGYLENEAFWQVVQALIEVEQSSEEGRNLQELLAVRQGLPQPSSARLL